MFKRSAAKVEALIKEEISKAEITINSVKPRRGAFEVTVDAKPVISLQGLKRPFPRLRNADLDAVAADAVKALGGAGKKKNK